MKKAPFHYLIAVSVILLQSCAIIRPGEVGLAVHRGKIKPGILMPGAHGKSIFGTKIARFDSRTKEYSSELSFHSKEGIEVTSETTMLYHFIPDSLPSIYLKFGQDYEKIVIINSLITALRREGLNHIATDLIIERTSFEKSIQEELKDILQIQLKDNIKARILDNELSNQYVNPRYTKKIRSQVETYNYLYRKAQ